MQISTTSTKFSAIKCLFFNDCTKKKENFSSSKIAKVCARPRFLEVIHFDKEEALPTQTQDEQLGL